MASPTYVLTLPLKVLTWQEHIKERKKRSLQRKLNRQRRANNPDKFNDDGTINKANLEKWKHSENYKKTRKELAL